MNEQLTKIEKHKEQPKNNLTPINKEPKEQEQKTKQVKTITLPSWSIEPPIEIKRGI